MGRIKLVTRRFSFVKMVKSVIIVLYICGIIYFLKGLWELRHPVEPSKSKVLAAVERSSLRSKSNRSPVASPIAVLVMVCDRLTVKRTVDQLIKYRPNRTLFPIIISMDCGKGSKEVESLLRGTYGKSVMYLKHPYYEKTQKEIDNEGVEEHLRGYYHIATHYGWALNQTFGKGYKAAIIVEDDLDIAPDFFEYFEATLPVLEQDQTLWCVSAYNDNGKPDLINMKARDLLRRTDFFPGLGWMLTSYLWRELRGKWPNKFWDDWMRQPGQRNERACIVPEVSRSKTFGRKGVSNGQYYDQYLKDIFLNDKFIPFKAKEDLWDLVKEDYDDEFEADLKNAFTIKSLQEISKLPEKDRPLGMEFKVYYEGEKEFKDKFADELGIIGEFKDGVPRNSYKGVVPIMHQGYRVYLVSKSHPTTPPS